MKPQEAYRYALKNYTEYDFDLNYYQEIACKKPHYALCFAEDIPGADIKYCQEYACKYPGSAYCFAKEVPGADIEYCRKACERDEWWLNKFDQMIIEKVML